MANLFNSNPLMGLGLALSTFGGQESMGTAMNLLNYAQRQQLIDEEKQKELRKEANAASYLKNSGGLDLAEGANQSRPLTIGEQVFNGYGPKTDTNKVDLMRAAGSENLLNSKLSAMAQADAPYTLGPNDKRIAGGKVVAENMIAPKQDLPSEAALVKYYQGLPDGPEKEQLGAIIQQKISGPAKSKWRTLSPQEAAALNLSPGGTYQIDDTSGQVQVLTQPSKDMGPGAIKLAAVRSATKPLLDSLDDFEKEVEKSDFWGRANAVTGGTSASGKALTTSWTNAAMQAKSEALFNLGVLSGPDLQMIEGALTNPATLTGARSSKGAYKVGIQKIKDLVKSRLAAAEESYSAEGMRPRAPQTSNGASGGWGPVTRIK